MSDSRAVAILDRLSALKARRGNFDSLWQQIADRVLPGSAAFNTQRTPGEQRTEKMYDATASLALRKYASIIESMSTPRSQQWHRLTAADDALADNPNVKLYLEQINKRLFKVRYAPSSNFTGQVGQTYLELGAFGNSSLFVDEEVGYGLRYRSIPLAESYFVENHVGLIDTMYRQFVYTAQQAMKRWPQSCPEQIRTAVARHPDTEFTFCHCVRPVSDEDTEQRVPRGAKFVSYYVSETGKALVQSGVYFTFPYPIARDLTASGEIYGRSPPVWVLPDIKMLNEMNRTIIRAGHKAVDPPVLLTEDGALSPFDMRPGAANYGALSATGQPLAMPFESKARLDIGLELMQSKQEVINEAFYITLFQILVESPSMTATEVLERAQEKGMLLGPLMGRQQSEFLGPMIERELDILARAGQLPPMPDELLEAGGEYKIEYESPLARAQRAEEGVAIVRTMESLMPIAQAQPDVLDNFDLDEVARTLGEVNGMAAKLFRPKDDVESMRSERQQQMQAQQMVEAAPPIAKAAKDVAGAAAAAA